MTDRRNDEEAVYARNLLPYVPYFSDIYTVSINNLIVLPRILCMDEADV